MICFLNKLRLAKLSILLLATFCCFSLPLFAQSVEKKSLNQQDRIIRNQQNSLEDKKRDLELKAIKKEYERSKKDKKATPEKLVKGELKSCVKVVEIKLINANSLTKNEQRKIAKPFMGKCIGAGVLESLIKAVNGYYQNNGYITTQVKVPEQNLLSGKFELEIIEGKIEKIIFGKDRFFENMQEFGAFGMVKNKTLNIDDINQGMYQINRLESNAAITKIEPGSDVGYSIIKIDNNKKIPAKLILSRDNLGNEFTGVKRSNVLLSYDNLLSLNDNLFVNYHTNINDDSNIKDIKSITGSLSVPYKYNTFSYDYHYSYFKGQEYAEAGPTVLSGYSQHSQIKLDRVFLNKTTLRLSGNVSLTSKSTASYIGNIKNEVSERRLSIVNTGLTISSYINDSTNIYLNPSYSRGVKLLDAKEDKKNTLSTIPKAQFDMYKLYANFSKNFLIPKTNIFLNFNSELSSQYSKQTIYGSEHFSVGGYYSVRGFRENFINGDSGYYSRNKLTLNLGSLMPAITMAKNGEQNKTGFFTKNMHHLNKISIEPFFDYGYVKNKYIDSGADGRLSGTGIMAAFKSDHFKASLTYSRALGHSHLITTNRENELVYFEISTSCCEF